MESFSSFVYVNEEGVGEESFIFGYAVYVNEAGDSTTQLSFSSRILIVLP